MSGLYPDNNFWTKRLDIFGMAMMAVSLVQLDTIYKFKVEVIGQNSKSEGETVAKVVGATSGEGFPSS